jgi:preprotein translocase subunit Sss1
MVLALKAAAIVVLVMVVVGVIGYLIDKSQNPRKIKGH